MPIHLKDYFVKPGKKINLQKHPTNIKPLYPSKSEYEKELGVHLEELRSLQNLLYAENSRSLLLIFQAMDAAGKDSAIKHVMSGVNPQGCQVFSFKHPSEEELDHDFLWRTTRNLPERGRIGIFNRSYYEEVLIVRVHPEILRAEHLPDHIEEDQLIWQKRLRSIRDLEKHLQENGTKILKFFLHVSKEEQTERFLKRIDDPQKNWKFSADDIKERAFWKQYMKAYEDCLAATSTADSPWYIIPADDKKNTALIISKIIVESLKDFEMSYPKIDQNRRRELQKLKKLLEEGKV